MIYLKIEKGRGKKITHLIFYDKKTFEKSLNSTISEFTVYFSKLRFTALENRNAAYLNLPLVAGHYEVEGLK